MRIIVCGIVVLAVLVVGSTVAFADGEVDVARTSSLCECETLTDSFFGLGTSMEEIGISPCLSLTQVYQRNAHGALDSNFGHYSMSYDLGFEFDLNTLMGWDGATMYILGEGSYYEGIDARAIGSLFGVNANAAGDRTLDITEWWYQKSWRDDNVILRFGKIDLTGGFDCCNSDVAFDCNAYASSSSSDFLNGSFGNSATVPFPSKGLGAALYVSPVERLYFAAGVGDAEADKREIGVSTAFDGDEDFFWVFEAGFVPVLASTNGDLPGAYRFGVWYDHQPKMYLDGSRTIDGDVGYYFSSDQKVWLENQDAEDAQGLGLFARCGWAREEVNAVKFAWSFGGEYCGILPGRDNDVMGVGFAQGQVNRDAGFPSAYEYVTEVYYNIEVTPWLHISPDVQWIVNPGADASVDNAVAVGVRAHMNL